MDDKAYATYLTKMRGTEGPHICARNVGRVEIGDTCKRSMDGECHCKPHYLYAQALHRDEWRRQAFPLGEDFAGEYKKGEYATNIRTAKYRGGNEPGYSDRQYHGSYVE